MCLRSGKSQHKEHISIEEDHWWCIFKEDSGIVCFGCTHNEERGPDKPRKSSRRIARGNGHGVQMIE